MADDGHAEPGRLAQVVQVGSGLRLDQHALGPLAGLLAETDTAVLDLDRDPGLHLDRGDVDAGLRRRVAGRVVEEFGHGVDQWLDGRAHDGDLGDGVQIDPRVLQDAGHRAAQHAEQRYGLGPLASRPGAAEHGDAVGETPDERVAVVEPEQVVEDLRLTAVGLLHLPQFRGLLVDDGLDAAGDADERELRALTLRLLVVDDLQQRSEDLPLRGGEIAVHLAVVDEDAHDLGGDSPCLSRWIAAGISSLASRTVSASCAASRCSRNASRSP